MEKVIYIEEGIYIILKEVLRTIKSSDGDMPIWCANGETYGYSMDYEKIKKESEKLNRENRKFSVRYTITKVKELK